MNNGNTLFWKNLRFLRDYYSESQEQLASFLSKKGFSTSSRSTISQWEKGARYPDDETIKAVAEHYDVYVQDLLHIDLSKYIQKNIFGKPNISNRIDLYLPIFKPDTPSNNFYFETAYEIQKEWYKWYTGEIKITINDLISEDLLDNYSLSIEFYRLAYNYKEVKEEVAANYIALIYFVSKIKNVFDKETLNLYLNKLKESLSVTSMFEHFKASIKETKLADNMEMKRLVVASDKKFLQLIKSEGITEWLYQKIFDKVLYEDMMKTLYQSKKYKDLAYYYEALYYLFGIINNDKNKTDNYRTGIEMLCLFARHGNNYAKAYLEYQLQLDESDYT